MLSETKSSSAGAKNKYLNKVLQISLSFFLGFLFVVFIIFIVSGIFVSKNHNQLKQATNENISVPLVTYSGPKFTLSYPNNYQLSENKIIATDGIIIDQTNTIHLISPLLNEKGGNMSMILTYKSLDKYQDDYTNSSTCPALNEKKLESIRIGNYTFTQSGQILCGPDEVAFFYIINSNNIYEVKVETTAEYETETLPEVLKILKTIKFRE